MSEPTEERIDSRAAHLLPEERAVGSDDPEAQAAAILDDSDHREAGRGSAPEHRTSEETATP
jgi:hypothetical protein